MALRKIDAARIWSSISSPSSDSTHDTRWRRIRLAMPASSPSLRSPSTTRCPYFSRQRDEIAFGIDDHLLHPLRRLLEQAPEQMRLARAGIALHQEPRRQQLLDVELGRRVRRPGFPC
jgi:hypothetical protein